MVCFLKNHYFCTIKLLKLKAVMNIFGFAYYFFFYFYFSRQ